VTGHEVENISIAVAAHGMTEDLHTVLHAGRGEVANETRSLFGIGVIRDLYRIGGAVLAAAALGSDASEGFLHEQTTYLLTPEREIEPFEAEAEVAAETAPGAEPARGEKPDASGDDG
jgi:hypothetical protein